VQDKTYRQGVAETIIRLISFTDESAMWSFQFQLSYGSECIGVAAATHVVDGALPRYGEVSSRGTTIPV
jgi:hypothetical protein